MSRGIHRGRVDGPRISTHAAPIPSRPIPDPHLTPGGDGPERPAPRLDYIDGLRGLAATCVLLHHAALEIEPSPARFHPSVERVLDVLLVSGHYAVAVFIVVSGYCLMLPVVRGGSMTLREGFPAYLLRRARRLLPPYYAALALCLLMIAVVPGMGRASGARWDWALPGWGGGVVVSHLFLVHNFWGGWYQKIDPPMWSLATEWQIYLLFPLLLLARRWLGMAAVVVLAYGLGNAALGVTGLGTFICMCPWFLGLFAMGMAAAEAGTTDAPRVRAWVGRVPWGLAAAVAAACFYFGNAYSGFSLVWIDAVLGVLTGCLLVGCSVAKTRGDSWLLRVLEARWAVRLGVFSYSLYLTHFPVLSLAHLGLRACSLGRTARLVALLTVAPFLCVVVAYGFYRAFERPFVRRRPPEAGTTPAAPAGVRASSAA